MDNKIIFQKMIQRAIRDAIDVKNKILNNKKLLNNIYFASKQIISCYQAGGKVLFCGNGGSAADAQHLAAELSGKFYFDRSPLFAEALHVNTSYLTAVANDYSFDEIYARYIKGAGKENDILVGISTSGNSRNIINAINEATNLGLFTIAFTGKTGGKLKDISNILINIPSLDTPRIQEAHIMVGHIICEIVETTLFPQKND